MAVSDYINSGAITPVAALDAPSAVFGPEQPVYNRLSRYENAALDDMRRNIDRAFRRLSSSGLDDPNVAGPALVGATKIVGVITAGEIDNLLVAYGDFRTEPGQNPPVAAWVAIGGGASQLTFTCRNPGNGSDQYPYGNKTILFFRDPVAPLSPLTVDTDIVTINGKNYRGIVINLETDGGGNILTIATDIEALCDPFDPAYDPNIGEYLAAAAGGGGLVAPTPDPVQLQLGVGGLYCVLISTQDSWDIHPVSEWGLAPGILILGNIDGTTLTADQDVGVAIVANGVSTIINVPVITPKTTSADPGAVVVRDGDGQIEVPSVPLAGDQATAADWVQSEDAVVLDNAVTYTDSAVSIFGARTYEVRITAADLTDAAVTQIIDLDAISPFPDSALILGGYVVLEELFSDAPAGIATLATAEIGDGVAATNVISDPVDLFATLGSKSAPQAAPGTYIFSAADSWRSGGNRLVPSVTITADVDVDTLTTGSCLVRIVYLPAVANTLHRRWTVDFSDLTAAALTETWDLSAVTPFPANSFKIFGWIRLNEAFAGPALGSATVELGDVGAPNGLVEAIDLMAAPGVYSIPGVEVFDPAIFFEAAWAPLAEFTTTVCDIADLTAGNLDIFVAIVPTY